MEKKSNSDSWYLKLEFLSLSLIVSAMESLNLSEEESSSLCSLITRTSTLGRHFLAGGPSSSPQTSSCLAFSLFNPSLELSLACVTAVLTWISIGFSSLFLSLALFSWISLGAGVSLVAAGVSLVAGWWQLLPVKLSRADEGRHGDISGLERVKYV